MNKIISIKNISKRYNTLNGEVNAIKDISFDVIKNDFISIVGPSGCGKSSLLGIISGLDNHYDGKVILNNCNVGYMFQEDALINHYNVFDNICIGLKIKKIMNKENVDYVNSLIKKYNLDDFRNKYPYELSGGMKQKVALIRTLATKPDVLLLDEPFSALDCNTRSIINDDIYKIIKDFNITVIMVTHDISEAISMSNKVLVLSKSPSYIINNYVIELNGDVPSIKKSDSNFIKYYEKILKDMKNV